MAWFSANKSHLDGCAPVQDYLLKKSLTGAESEEPNKLSKEQKGVGDIKAVGLYENYANLIDEKYHQEMCLRIILYPCSKCLSYIYLHFLN